MRSAILTVIACTVAIASGIMLVPVPAAEDLPRVSSAAPVKVPYLDFDLEQLAIIRDYQEAHEEHAEPQEMVVPEEISMETETAVTEEINEPESLGTWTITAYCPGPCCCGEYASGYTASGTVATAVRTIACNSLPFGTQVMIDGIVYTVEDTGYSPFGDNWIDIFFDTHDEALTFGVQEKEVYLIGD